MAKQATTTSVPYRHGLVAQRRMSEAWQDPRRRARRRRNIILGQIDGYLREQPFDTGLLTEIAERFARVQAGDL